MITEASADDSDGGLASYQLVLRDALAILEKRSNTPAFRNMNEVEIVQRLLHEWRHKSPILGTCFLHDTDEAFELAEYPRREFTMQHNESDAAFIRRLLSRRDPAAYRLYIEARKLWRSKQAWVLTREENAKILKDVSTAADMGDWGARALMAHFYLYGLGGLETNKVLDPVPEKAIEIERMAVAAGQPWGFYDLGVAYEHGYGDVPQDTDLAWAYYLRAAELGSPDAQMALASAYGDARRFEDE
ncbi:MAG: contractile injection system protein, VgrG/Pvc8 family, partial [Duganella sp.]